MRFISLAAAVTGALTAGAAFGLAPGTVTTINLTVAGSSAARNTFQTAFGSLCQAGTLDTFKGNAGDNPDFRAYSCTLLNAAPVPTALQGKTATAWYRSEGGSVMGVAPLVKNVNLARLDNSAANCGAPISANNYTCPVVGYNFVTDLATSGVTYAKVQLGVSDVEPTVLTGENWGSQFTFLGADPGAAGINAGAAAKGILGQVFTIVLSKGAGVPTDGITNLRKQDITSIFAGSYSDWSQVQNAAATGFLPAGPITVCRRDTGSGTQASASIFFNGIGCSSTSYPFVTAPTAPLGNPVITNLTTTAVKNCINTAALAGKGAIGIVGAGNTPTNGNTVSIDGIAGTATTTALGQYQYAFEATFNTPKLYSVPANEAALVSYMTTRLQTNASAPNNPSVFSLPVGANIPTIPLTVNGAGQPIALGSRSGNSCLAPQNQN